MDNSHKLTGTVIDIGEAKAITQYLTKRQFKIRFTETDRISNRVVERKVRFDTVNDFTAEVDKIRLEDIIDVHFYVEGRDYEKDGKTLNFTTLACYEIDVIMSPSRDTKEDKKATITEEGRIYKEPVKEATDEELAGIVKPGEQDPLLKLWDEKKGKYLQEPKAEGSDMKSRVLSADKDPFSDVEEVKQEEFKDLPF